MFCENCGAKLADTAKFCRYCGASLGPAEPVDGPLRIPHPAKEKPRDTAEKKKALIEYLDALYTAEMGVEYCDQLIRMLEEEKKYFPKQHAARFEHRTFKGTVAPHRDIFQEYRDSLREKRKCVKAGQDYKAGRGLGYILAPSKYDLMMKKHLESSLADLYQLEHTTEADLARRQAVEDQRYARDVKSMETMKAAFEAQERRRKEVYDMQGKAACEEYDKSIQEVQARREEFCAMRDTLYQQDLLYEKFRNPVAESQLRDYLDMGLVDSLEGPQGGYAFYLSELQSRHICGSIQELQQSMETHLNEISAKMSGIIGELQTANERLSNLRRTICDCNYAIFHSQDAMGKTAKELKKQINDLVSPIREAVQRSEYNLYLEQMRKELGRSRYGRLMPPSSDLHP